MSRILEIQDLTLGYRTESGTSVAVRDFSVGLEKGESLGLIGESGAGKSTVALEVLGLLRHRRGLRLKGKIDFYGRRMAYIPQDPLSALDPLFSIGHQAREVLAAAGQKTDEAEIQKLFQRVRLSAEKVSLKSYPHELSGGMRQRVVIALALAKGPDLMVADEPTSSLDVTLQAEVVRLLHELKEQGISFLFITHNLLLAGEFCDRLAVLCQGRLLEVQWKRDLFRSPQQDYTRRLLHAVPRIDDKSPQTLGGRTEEGTGRSFFAVRGLRKAFPLRRGIFKTGARLEALSGVTLELEEGKTYGLVGESGSGKTTLARILLRLIPPTEGEVVVRGKNLTGFSRSEMRLFRREVQLVFQNPALSLDPYWKLRDLVAEAIRRSSPRIEVNQRVEEILTQMGLGPQFLGRLPGTLSGGEKQRVALARALILRPKFLVLDEPTSQLDVSVQAQMVELLRELKQRWQFGYLFITHDLALVKEVAEEVFVLFEGRIVEHGRVENIFTHPKESYTQRLLASYPRPVL